MRRDGISRETAEEALQVAWDIHKQARELHRWAIRMRETAEAALDMIATAEVEEQ